MRSCVEIDPSMDGECVDHVEQDGSERHLCYCAEDGCNATPDTVKVPSKCLAMRYIAMSTIKNTVYMLLIYLKLYLFFDT